MIKVKNFPTPVLLHFRLFVARAEISANPLLFEQTYTELTAVPLPAIFRYIAANSQICCLAAQVVVFQPDVVNTSYLLSGKTKLVFL